MTEITEKQVVTANYLPQNHHGSDVLDLRSEFPNVVYRSTTSVLGVVRKGWEKGSLESNGDAAENAPRCVDNRDLV